MQLITTDYHRGNADNKWTDSIIMVVKNEDGTKEIKTIQKPKFRYYISKPEYDDNIVHNFMKQEQVRQVQCNYNELFKSISNELKDKRLSDFISDAYRNGGRDRGNLLNQVHLDTRLHGTDIHITDYYMGIFLQKYPYTKNNFGLTKCFFDIEVDSSEIQGFPEQEKAECPVNAITMVDINNKKIYTYLLSYEGHKGYDEFITKIEEFKTRIKARYKEETKMDFDIEINIYEEEDSLIYSFFETVNEQIRPDFLCAWNADFDIPYLLNRIDRLGYDRAEICCPQEFPIKQAYYKIDTSKKDLSDKSSTYQISGYTNYIDLMCLYANITKPIGKEESYSLDYIGQKVTGMSKDEVVDNMKTFHFANFEKFVEYNIQDTIMLAMIEVQTLHIDLVYTVSCITQTRITKAMKKTVCLKNLARQYAFDQGYVQSNNRAGLHPQIEGKIKGAFVAIPENIAKVGMYIYNELSRFIFECCTDLDLASLYPSIMRALNISVETCIGKVYIDLEGCDGETLLQDYLSGDILNFGAKYLNLPTVAEMVELIEEELKKEDNCLC